MGRLIPANLDVAALEPSERRTVEALLTGTGEEWLVIPHVPFVERGREGEADVVVLHPELGGVVLEVKGGRISVREGAWYQDGRLLPKSPVDQAARAMHTLIRKMQSANGSSPRPRLVHGIVLPDASTVPEGSLGPDLEPAMVFTGRELTWPEEALRQLMTGTAADPGSHRRIDLAPAVRALRPDLDFVARLSDEITALERRLDDDTDATLRNLEQFDTNPRIVVTGPAGSGKSRLALRWAERAVARSERTALMCFNRPMGDIFTAEFADRPEVFAGTFH
ncbi:MAG: NERD domain-containing protein, partial [Actinomycetota bacterium]